MPVKKVSVTQGTLRRVQADRTGAGALDTGHHRLWVQSVHNHMRINAPGDHSGTNVSTDVLSLATVWAMRCSYICMY